MKQQAFEEQSMSEVDWWQTMFDQKYLDTYLGSLTPERTKQEVDFVVEAAKLKSDEVILDLACGHGRHSIELASRGYPSITGLDYSQVFLDKAEVDATNKDVSVRFVQGDMRALPFTGEFNVAYTIYTTLGYFDDGTNAAVFKQVNKALKPNGRFFIDNISAEAVANRFKTLGTLEPEIGLLKMERQAEMTGHMVDEVEWYDSEKQIIHDHREWHDNGEKKEYDYWLHVYTMPQHEQMLTDAGFEIEKTWGNYDKQPFGAEDTHRVIILARKVKN